MTILRTLCLAITATILIPFADVRAQQCLGLPSLATRHANLLLDAQFTSGVKGFGARLGFGSSVGFAGVTGQLERADGVDGTAKLIGVDGGLTILVGEKKNVTFCPIAGLSYTTSPDNDVLGESADANYTEGTAGVAVGGKVKAGTNTSLIPFASVSAAYSRFTFTYSGDSESSSDTFGILSGGVGILLNEKVVIRPTISIPLGLEGGDPSYGIGVAFSFGNR